MHLMIDMETLSTRPNAVVLSVGLVLMDTHGEPILTHEVILDAQEQISAGRDVEADTLAWWMNQGAEARAVFEQSAKYGMKVERALTHIAELLEQKSDRRDLCVWSNAATFDIVILRSLYEQLCPNKWRVWNYQNERCYRTIVSTLDPSKRFAPPTTGTKHNALDDAIWQAEYLSILNQKTGGTILRRH